VGDNSSITRCGSSGACLACSTRWCAAPRAPRAPRTAPACSAGSFLDLLRRESKMAPRADGGCTAAACDARVSTVCAAEPDADGGRYADSDAHAAGAEQVRLTREWQEIKFKCCVGPMDATSAAAALRLAATSALRVAGTQRDGGRTTLPTPAYAPGRGRSAATRCPTRSFSQYVDSPAAGSSPLMATCKVARRSAPTTGKPSASFCIVQSSHSDAEEEASTGSRTRLCDTSIYLCIYISIHLPINACIHPSTRPSINTSIHHHTHPSSHQSINTPIHQHIHPSTHQSINTPIHQHNNSSTQ